VQRGAHHSLSASDAAPSIAATEPVSAPADVGSKLPVFHRGSLPDDWTTDNRNFHLTSLARIPTMKNVMFFDNFNRERPLVQPVSARPQPRDGWNLRCGVADSKSFV
jgi:hypothetical protein